MFSVAEQQWMQSQDSATQLLRHNHGPRSPFVSVEESTLCVACSEVCHRFHQLPRKAVSVQEQILDRTLPLLLLSPSVIHPSLSFP